MCMEKFNLIKKEIGKIIIKSPLVFDPIHSKLTLKWVLKLKSDADESLKIASLAHDIERAVTGITEKDLEDYSKIKEFKKEHAVRSAKITCDLMKRYKYNEEIIDKVKGLIENHEEGGDVDSNILMEADSLAYFDYNIDYYFKRYGKERTKEKIKFMYKRLEEKARRLAKQIKFKDKEMKDLFQEAISEI